MKTKIITPEDYEVRSEKIIDCINDYRCPTCGKEFSSAETKIKKDKYIDSVVTLFSCENCEQEVLAHGYLKVVYDIDFDLHKVNLIKSDNVEFSQIIVLPTGKEKVEIMDRLPEGYEKLTEESIKNYDLSEEKIAAAE